MSERAGDAADTADQRREQMLRAAIAVIEERGFPETRIADVAARAGTSPALVIYYFKTKDQLLTEALRYAEDAWYEAGTRRMAAIVQRRRAAGGTGRDELPRRDGGRAHQFVAALARFVGPVGAAARSGERPAEVRRALA